MIREFHCVDGRLILRTSEDSPGTAPVWIDLVNPAPDEELAVEERLGIDVPTREEMDEIEISSRLYNEAGVAFMTAILPAQADAEHPQISPVSFVLAAETLVTIRYHEPRAFETFPVRAGKVDMGCESADGVLLALLEAIVDRIADVLERAGRNIDRLSRDVFRPPDGRPTRAQGFNKILESIGHQGDLASNIRESLVTLERLVGFLNQRTFQARNSRTVRERVKTLLRDVRSIADHAGSLTQKITFLLDATLGMINIEQNAIIKIFSVAAVVFLPPTLIASIYGMNFDFMPELKWPLGYPLALGLMVLSAILPYLFFKRRGWL